MGSIQNARSTRKYHEDMPILKEGDVHSNSNSQNLLKDPLPIGHFCGNPLKKLNFSHLIPIFY